MAGEVAALCAELELAKQENSAENAEALRADVTAAKQVALRADKSANEWKDTTSITPLAGYASADYISPEAVVDRLQTLMESYTL